MSRLRVIFTRSTRVAVASVILLTLAAIGAIRWLTVDLPSPDRLYERAAAPSTRIYDRYGRLLYEIRDPHGGTHTPVLLTEIPQACIDATIATEDASFYRNPGVDAWAIARALWINLRGGEILSGHHPATRPQPAPLAGRADRDQPGAQAARVHPGLAAGADIQ
jgi:membrane carboxypeptidase/penicillin-binding protein